MKTSITFDRSITTPGANFTRLGLFALLLTMALVYLGFSLLQSPSLPILDSDTSINKPFSYLPYVSEEAFVENVLSAVPESLKGRVKQILPAVIFTAIKHGVNPLWILSVMWNESHFNPNAISYVGARGVMQIMPETRVYIKGHFKRKKLGYAYDSLKMQRIYKRYYPELGQGYKDLLENIEYGVFYLRLLHNRFGNLQYAIVAYNMGPGWLRYRLKNNLPVGVKNLYLNKVRKTFRYLQEKLNLLTAQNDIKNIRS